MNILEYKKEHPEYNNIPDAIVAEDLYTKYYSDEDQAQFMADVGITDKDLQIAQAYKNKPELTLKRLVAMPGEGIKTGIRQSAHGIATQGKFKTEEEVKQSTKKYYESTLSQTERLQYGELTDRYTDEWTPSDKAQFKALKEIVEHRGRAQAEMFSEVEHSPYLESSPEFMQSTGQIEDIVTSTFASVPNIVFTGANPIIGGMATYYRMLGATHKGMIEAGAEDNLQTYRYSVGTAVVTTPMEFASNMIQFKAMTGNPVWKERAKRFIESWAGEAATEFLQQPIEYTATVMAVNPDLNAEEILKILNSEKSAIFKNALYSGWIGGWSGGLTTGAGMTAFDILPSMVSDKQAKINLEKRDRVEEILHKDELTEEDKIDLLEIAGVDPEIIEDGEIDKVVDDIKTRLLYQDAEPLQSPGKDQIAETLVKKYGERQAGVYLTMLDSIARAGVDQGLYTKPEDFYTQELGDIRESKVEEAVEGRYQEAPEERTPEFKEWFGDSKVVDEKGEPLIVYHGTPEGGFTEFDEARQGTRTTGKPDKSRAFHFAERLEDAKTYSLTYRKEFEKTLIENLGYIPESQKAPEKAEDYRVYLSMENPLQLEFSKEITKGVISNAKKHGYDGIITKMGLGKEYVVFNPNQIKLTTTTKPTKASDDIRFQDKRGAVEYLFDETPTIMHLFESANASTPIHEIGHILLEMMYKSGSRDYLQMAKHFGISEKQTIAGTKAWDTKQHEAFAKSFEAYCMEGKAPTMKLQQIFESMKDMLLKIYKSLANRYFSDVKMNDDVRAIFDRWIADDMARQIDPVLSVEEWVGVKNLKGRPQTTFHTYNELQAEARRQVALKIQKQYKDKRAKAYAKLKTEAERIVNNTPEIIIKEEVNKKGVNPDSLKSLLSKEEIQTLKENNVKISKKGVDIYKEAYNRGVEADELLGILFNTQTREQAVKQQFNLFKKAYLDNIRYELASAEEKVLKKEIEILYKLLGKKPPKKNLKKTIREATGQVQEEDYQTLVDKYKAEEKKAQQAFKNKEKLIKLKEAQKERIQKIRELYKQQKEKQRIHKRLGRLVRQKSITYEFKQWINYLTGQFLKIPKTFAVPPPSGNVREFISNIGEETGILVDEHLNMIDSIPDVITGEMSFEDLQNLHKGIEAIANIELQVRRGGIEKGKESFKAKTDRIIEEIESNFNFVDKGHPLQQQADNLKFLNKMDKQTRRYFSSLVKPEFIMKQLDGWQDMGVVWSEVFEPIKKAEDQSLIMKEEATKKMAEIFEGFDNKWRTEKVYINSLKRSISKETMVMIALNSANKDNRRCLIEGNGVTEEAITEILSNLSKKESKLVNDIWNLVDSFYDDRSAVHKEITGAPLDKVEGKYFPIMHDPNLSRTAMKHSTEDQLFNNTGLNRKNVKASARKGRIGSNYALNLQFGDIERSVAESIQDISFQIPVREAHRLIRDKGVADAMTNAIGAELYSELPKWVNTIANPRAHQVGISQFERIMNMIRRNTTTIALGWKISVSLKQIGSIGQTADRVGTGRTINAMMRFYTNPNEMKAFVDNRSVSIRNRGDSYEQNLKDRYHEVVASQFQNKFKKMENSFFAMIQFVDSLAVYPSWIAAYEKGIEDFDSNETKAIEYADMVVRTTQPTASPKDLPSIMTGNQLQRMFTMFYTYMSISHNNLREAGISWRSGQINTFTFAKALYLRLIIPGLIGALVNEIGEDEWDTMRVTGNTLSLGVGGLPYLRDLANFVMSDYGYTVSPIEGAGKSGEWLWKELTKDERDALDIAKAMIQVAGYAKGLPSSQVLTTIDGILNEDNPVYWAIRRKK